MARPTITPTGHERTFHEDEIIVSKTDLKGIITYANLVFQRVSGFTEQELLGKPHIGNTANGPSTGGDHLFDCRIDRSRQLGVGRFGFADHGYVCAVCCGTQPDLLADAAAGTGNQ